MALPANRSISEIEVSAYMADLSTESSAFAVAPCRGRVRRVKSTIYNAITGANAGWTVKIAGTTVTGLSATVTQSGSAAGDVDESETNSLTNACNEGDNIQFLSDGLSTTTCPVTFTAVIERE